MAEEQKQGDNQAGDSASNPPKKALNPITIGLALQSVLMLALVGFVGKTVFMTPKPDLSPQLLQERVVASIRDENADIQYLPIKELVVNMDAKHTIKAELVLEVSNAEILQLFTDRAPIIRSKVLRVLSGQTFSRVDKIQGKLELKDRLIQVLNQELADSNYRGNGTVRDIYFVDLLLL